MVRAYWRVTSSTAATSEWVSYAFACDIAHSWIAAGHREVTLIRLTGALQ